MPFFPFAELPKEDSIVTLSGAARAILSTPDPVEKVMHIV